MKNKEFRIIIKTTCISYYSRWLDANNFTIFELYNLVKPILESKFEYFIEFKDVEK